MVQMKGLQSPCNPILKVLYIPHGSDERDENGNPLDGTVRENKLLLGSVKVEDVEDIEILDEAGGKSYIKQKRIRFFRSLIFDKAMELAAVTAESEIKNL